MYTACRSWKLTLVTGPRRTMMLKKIKVTLVWGSGYDVEKTYEFASPAEKDAFMKGVEAMDGWLEYSVVGDDK